LTDAHRSAYAGLLRLAPAGVTLRESFLRAAVLVATAVIARPKHTFVRLGIDSIALVAVYAAVIALLPQVT